MEQYYVGTDLKFKINLSAAGFSMDEDDFLIEIFCSSKRMEYKKEDLIDSTDGYYLVIDTTQFPAGQMKMVVTAFVPDEDIPGGVRKEVGVCDLCTIKKPLK